MQFEIVWKGQSAHTYTSNVIYLLEDRWNDWFHYVTMFQLVYIDNNGMQHDLGSAKFGQFSMTDEQKSPDLPKTFETLDVQFFSLGQSEDYYENIKNIEQGELREEILLALNDIAFSLDLFERACGEKVTQDSLLRDIRENTVSSQFHRIATGGAKLTSFDIVYTVAGQSDTHFYLDFHVAPNSFPPTNIHVVIGRNGVGKTHLFQSMIHCLSRGNIDNQYGTFSMESQNKLSNFVCVAFSPFDLYPHPDDLEEDGRNRNKYTYIGLESKAYKENESRLSHLEGQFAAAFNTCAKYKEKRILWTSIISLLDSDPMFKNNNFSDLLSSNIDGVPIESAQSLFKKLSSGHKVILLTLTCLVAVTVERTLILIDEPENHLHPPLLSAFVRALSELLIRKNGLAIIATHSPVVLQEVPRSCVQRLSRINTIIKAEPLDTETFGESINTLTNEVFGLEVTHSGFHKIISDMADNGLTYDEILARFNSEIGSEARSVLRVLLSQTEGEASS